jgi:hypothetical protein
VAAARAEVPIQANPSLSKFAKQPLPATYEKVPGRAVIEADPYKSPHRRISFLLSSYF